MHAASPISFAALKHIFIANDSTTLFQSLSYLKFVLFIQAKAQLELWSI